MTESGSKYRLLNDIVDELQELGVNSRRQEQHETSNLAGLVKGASTNFLIRFHVLRNDLSQAPDPAYEFEFNCLFHPVAAPEHSTHSSIASWPRFQPSLGFDSHSRSRYEEPSLGLGSIGFGV